jgi:hypothetical protein
MVVEIEDALLVFGFRNERGYFISFKKMSTLGSCYRYKWVSLLVHFPGLVISAFLGLFIVTKK